MSALLLRARVRNHVGSLVKHPLCKLCLHLVKRVGRKTERFLDKLNFLLTVRLDQLLQARLAAALHILLIFTGHAVILCLCITGRLLKLGYQQHAILGRICKRTPHDTPNVRQHFRHTVGCNLI